MPPVEAHQPGDGSMADRADRADPILPERLTAARTIPAGRIVRNPDGSVEVVELAAVQGRTVLLASERVTDLVWAPEWEAAVAAARQEITKTQIRRVIIWQHGEGT